MPSSAVSLTVLIPAINEEESLRVLLPEIHATLAGLVESHEILVVEGGSRDQTAAAAREGGAVVLPQKKPGFGMALAEGFEAARGEYILAMDGDSSHPCSEIRELWKSREGWDLVAASRFAPGGSAELSWSRWLLSRALNWATSWLLEFPIRDASSGFRLYKSSALKGLSLHYGDFSVQQEILAKIIKNGGKVREIPFHYHARRGGASKARVASLAKSYLRMMWELKILLSGVFALAAPAAVLLLGLGAGLWGLRWGLPGKERLRILPGGRPLSQEAADKMAEHWAGLYREIRRSHREMRREEPVTYVKGLVEIPPGWDFPPPPLINSYRSFLVQSANPDEKKSFIILSQMRPWRLEFKPLYAQYGGAFVYPLGLFLQVLSWTKAAVLTPDLSFYLRNPEQMGRLYLCGRLFILIFQLASLLIVYHMGRELSGRGAGLAAALFFLLSPAVVHNSHVLKPHPYAAFWALAASYAAALIQSRASAARYLACGVCGGMAVGSNMALVFFAGGPAVAWFFRAWARKNQAEERPWALGGLALGLCLFVLFNPYLISSYKDFAWELEVYSPTRLGLHLTALARLPKAAAEGLGPVLAAAMGLGVFWGASRKGPGRILSCFFLGSFALIWLRLGGVPLDSSFLRLLYPLMGLGSALAAALLWRAPRGIRAGALALIFFTSGLESLVLLENMRRDGGPGSTWAQAADWLEAHVPAGESLGLARYPEPAHAPALRYDRYALSIFSRPEELPKGKLPNYLLLDEIGKAAIDNWAQKNYDGARAFSPWRALWSRPRDSAFFANQAIYIYHRHGRHDDPQKPSTVLGRAGTPRGLARH
ncbi:MAG: glycosyltransferase [Elusimicrobia bacterium]|nr:glycosyltransferase [Elusimicrobiota bacterium]